MWGPYNMGLCRSPHIAMKLSPREQQLCLSEVRDQRTEVRKHGTEQRRLPEHHWAVSRYLPTCFHPQALASSQLPSTAVTNLPDGMIGALHEAIIPSYRTLSQQVRKSCVVTEWQFRAPAAKSHFWTVWRVSGDGRTSSATSSRVRYFPAQGFSRGFCLHSLLF